VRAVAGLRHAVPAPPGHAAVPADPDDGAHARDRVRRDRTAAGLHRLAAGRGALRTPGRHAVRLAVDPPLARAAAVRAARAKAPVGAALLQQDAAHGVARSIERE